MQETPYYFINSELIKGYTKRNFNWKHCPLVIFLYVFTNELGQLVWNVSCTWKCALKWKKYCISKLYQIFSPYKHVLATLLQK